VRDRAPLRGIRRANGGPGWGVGALFPPIAMVSAHTPRPAPGPPRPGRIARFLSVPIANRRQRPTEPRCAGAGQAPRGSGQGRVVANRGSAVAGGACSSGVGWLIPDSHGKVGPPPLRGGEMCQRSRDSCAVARRFVARDARSEAPAGGVCALLPPRARVSAHIPHVHARPAPRAALVPLGARGEPPPAPRGSARKAPANLIDPLMFA
jgi:hypothetical protein